jgi:poly-gamma-glutamate synthesis protein (capsule biosynthesis protein)
MKSLQIIILVVILGIATTLCVLFFVKREPAVDTSDKASNVKTPSEEIRLVFVGDIMLSRSIGKKMKMRNDYFFPFASTTEFIRRADIAFANLENPISSRGIKSGSIYSFRAEPQTVGGLKYAGFDVISIANNHIWDYGKLAFNDTLAYLSENGIETVGGGKNYEKAHTAIVKTVGKTKIAFLAYTNLIAVSLGQASSTPAVARFNDKMLKTDIASAKESVDAVVVSFHWGDEYETKHNAEQERVGKLSIDAGASLVVGHHPHVVQEVEKYNDGYIAYSLGNFIFDQNFSKDTSRGMLLSVLIRDKKIAEVTEIPIVFSDDYHPYIETGTDKIDYGL